MRQVIWHKSALEGFETQIAFISEQSPQNATLVSDRLFACVSLLGEVSLGHAGRVLGTWEFPVPKTSHIIAYFLHNNDTEVHIVRVIHTARDWPLGQWLK